MTPDQAATLILRTAAVVVWIAYLWQVARHGLRHSLIVAMVVLYAAAQTYRAALHPATTQWEFTAVSVVVLIVGLALLTVRHEA